MSNENAQTRQVIFSLRSQGLTPVILNGKRPIIPNWQKYRCGPLDPRSLEGLEHNRSLLLTDEVLISWLTQYPNANIGVLCHTIVCLDFDDESIWPIIRDLTPRTGLVKVGARGFTLIYRQSQIDPVIQSRGFVNRFTKSMMLEVLSDGRQTVLPPSMHPDTGRPYHWASIADWGTPPAHAFDLALAETLAQSDVTAIEERLLAHGLTGAVRERSAPTGRPIQDAERPRYTAIMQMKLSDRLAELVGAERGGRQNALNGLCYALAPYVREGFMDEGELEGLARAACERNGLLAEDGEKRFSRDFYKGLADGSDRELQPLRDVSPEGLFGGAPTIQAPSMPDAPAIDLKAFSTGQALREATPEREWTCEGVIPHKQITLLYADGGGGKTTQLIQMFIAISRGEKWMGQQMTRRRTLFVSGEDEENELRFRIAQAARYMGAPADDDSLTVSLVSQPDTFLATVGSDGRVQPTALFWALKRLVIEQRIECLGLDPVAVLFAGNQNDMIAVYGFVALLRHHFALECGCTVIIAAHPSKSGMSNGSGDSGSVAWNNACRSRLYFHKADVEDPDMMCMELVKANRGKTGLKILCKWVDGVFLHVGAQYPMGGGNVLTMTADGELTNPACEAFLGILTRMVANGQRLSPNPGISYAPALVLRHPDAKGFNKREMGFAMARLLDSGKICVEKEATGTSKERSLLVPRLVQKEEDSTS